MLMYEKKENIINIYSVIAVKEKFEEFKKKELLKSKKELMFCSLKTNCKDTIDKFQTARNIDLRFLDYDNDMDSSLRTWSSVFEMKNPNSRDICLQEEILEKYINGNYNSLTPTRVFKFVWDEDLVRDVYRLLMPQDAINDLENNWEIKNMINLPKSLYLLQLLQNEVFFELEYEDLSEQLQLFDINYLENISLKDIKESISSGSLEYNYEEIVNKAELGAKILGKRKKSF